MMTPARVQPVEDSGSSRAAGTITKTIVAPPTSYTTQRSFSGEDNRPCSTYKTHHTHTKVCSWTGQTLETLFFKVLHNRARAQTPRTQVRKKSPRQLHTKCRLVKHQTTNSGIQTCTNGRLAGRSNIKLSKGHVGCTHTLHRTNTDAGQAHNTWLCRGKSNTSHK